MDKIQYLKTCFCSLALGDRYRSHAIMLAKDLQKYAPKHIFLVLTDDPKAFQNLSNTIALKHYQKSIGCYQDKREVIKQALNKFESCLFLDSDVRILKDVPENLTWPPGITAHSRSSFSKHLSKHIGSQTYRELIEKVAKKLGLNKEDSELKFIQEYCFAVSKDNGKELIFLDYWEKISIFLEINGFIYGEGFTIGLAAAKADFKTHYRGEMMDKIEIFNDRLEKDKIKKGLQSSPQALQCYEDHKQIQFSHKSVLNKILDKSRRILARTYLFIFLRLKTLKDLNFYLYDN